MKKQEKFLATMGERVSNLPSNYLAVSQLRYHEEFSNQQIASILDIKVDNISEVLRQVEDSLSSYIDDGNEDMTYEEVMKSVFDYLIDNFTMNEYTSFSILCNVLQEKEEGVSYIYQLDTYTDYPERMYIIDIR